MRIAGNSENVYNSEMSLSDFIDNREKTRYPPRTKSYMVDCPKCGAGSRIVGSKGSKACRVCGYTRTKRV